MAVISVVLESDVNGSLLILIKKHTGLSLSEIKSNIKCKTPILIVNRRDKDEMEKMKDIVKKLLSNHATLRIYKKTDGSNEEMTYEAFINGFEKTRQIEKDRERIDDLLIPEDDDN